MEKTEKQSPFGANGHPPKRRGEVEKHSVGHVDHWLMPCNVSTSVILSWTVFVVSVHLVIDFVV